MFVLNLSTAPPLPHLIQTHPRLKDGSKQTKVQKLWTNDKHTIITRWSPQRPPVTHLKKKDHEHVTIQVLLIKGWWKQSSNKKMATSVKTVLLSCDSSRGSDWLINDQTFLLFHEWSSFFPNHFQKLQELESMKIPEFFLEAGEKHLPRFQCHTHPNHKEAFLGS